MPPMFSVFSKVIAIVCAASLCPVFAQAPLPANDVQPIASIIERDFDSIDNIHTIGMTDDPDGRFDVIVVGSSTGNRGWRVEVLSTAHHKVTTIWDSHAFATEPQYSNSGPQSVTVVMRDYDYDLLIDGCAPHLCHDGVSGFLLFTGKSRATAKAKVVTRDLDKGNVENPEYDVTFSKNADDRSKVKLEKAICRSWSISNRSGLPFVCPGL